MGEETKKQDPTRIAKENVKPELTETDLKEVNGGVQSESQITGGHEPWVQIL
jgi:hypothetical protein